MPADVTKTPFEPEPEFSAKAEDAADSAPTIPKGSLRILLVEDDQAVRGVVQRVLTRMGHEVLACSGPDETTSAGSYDLALVDLNLGGSEGDGLRLLQTLRERRPQAGFILTSGSRPTLPSAEEGGPHFLRKPFSRTELQSIISKLQGAD